ncbi:ABC transporter substrate-binding protein [Saccharomonospora sp. CUA-673]|uniref:ABC transporter substrate-binding protein n=1 Tax=Saccharomonospora sp. CUA-673 TaxID=1904969 RepID=UPI0035181F2D
MEDRTVRQAVARAIDTEELIDRALGGYGQQPGGLVPEIYEDFHYEPPADEAYAFAPERANQMLDEAGYEQGPDGVRRTPDGEPLEFSLTARSSEEFHVRTADYIVGWLGDIGIEVTKDMVSDNEMDEKTTGGEYDLAISGYGTNPDPDYVLSMQTCDALPTSEGSGRTSAFYCNPEFDDLYRQQLAEMDTEQRAEIVKDAQAMVYRDVPSYVLTYQQTLEAYRSDRWTGFPRQPEGDGVIMEQSGYWGFAGASPVEGGGGGGLPTGAWVAIGVVALAALAGGGTVLMRRKASADDRE